MRDARLTGYAQQMRKRMTEPETRLWLQLRAGRFEGVKFRRQKVIGRYIADFAANEPKLVIEVDGDTHDVDDERDRIRTRYLEKQGYTVLRFSNMDVMGNLDGVLMRLGEVLASLRTPPLPTLSPEGARAITLAAFTGAHGVTGEVRLKLFGEGVAALKRHKSFNDAALTLKSVRDDNKGGAIARFAEIADRTAAEKLRGTLLTVPRSALPPLDDGEYYHADLLGLAAVSDSGEPLGVVVAVENYGAGDILEIERASGKRFMAPMRADAVPEWNEQRVVVASAFAEE
jgi:16S rRNA processing protein RimM